MANLTSTNPSMWKCLHPDADPDADAEPPPRPRHPTKTWASTFKRKTSQLLHTLPTPYTPFRIAKHVWQKTPGVFPSKDIPHEELPLSHSDQLRQNLKEASTAKDWRKHAEALDLLEGNDDWKIEEECQDYDVDLLRKRLATLKQANHDSDMEAMLDHVRNYIKRDLGGICNPELYRYSYIGTKYLIDEYTEVVKYTIDRLVDYCENNPDADVPRYHAVMQAAKKSFGKTALMLSGGGTLGMCHIGVVKALLEANLLPTIVCGASAGSIVGAVLCTHRRDEILGKLAELIEGDCNVFQGSDEMQGMIGAAVNVTRGETAFDVSNLCRVMKKLLGDITFQEANNLTGMTLNIHVSCKDKHNLPRLLNYITAPNVIIWSAVASSCSVPYVFHAPGLQTKDPETGQIVQWGSDGHKWIDGSIQGDLPFEILERLFNVNNFIACQVNPHVQIFLDDSFTESSVVKCLREAAYINSIFLLDVAIEFADLSLVRMLHSVLTQKYDGDITLLPPTAWARPTQILANPSRSFLETATRHGEQATWPKLDRIRNSVAIELHLERGTNDLQAAKLMRERGLRPFMDRAMSSTRSERGLGRRRTKSGSAAGFGAIPHLPRGRGRGGTMHMPIRSMIEPVELSLLTTGLNIRALSSSDEKGTDQSSPVTSYADEDFDDVTNRNGGASTPAGLNIAEADRRMLAFLSQPTSPSTSFKSYFGPESNPTPRSLELRRALDGLQMSTINEPTPSVGTFRKGSAMSRKEYVLFPDTF